MKEKYITPDMEIVLFDCEDVITTSGEPISVMSLNEMRFMPASYINEIDNNQWS